MKRVLLPLMLAVLIVPAMGATQIGVSVGPRDTTELEQTLADVNEKQADYISKTEASDEARAAFEAAEAALNTAIEAELASRTSLEASQQAYADAYEAFEKEDQLRP